MTNTVAITADETYMTEVAAWRNKMSDDLRAPDGWLSLAGLFELREGEQTIGSDETCDVALPASAPAQLGVLRFKNGQTHLSITSDVTVWVDGAPAREAVLADDGDGAATPTKVSVGTVTLFVHSYDGRYAIRVKDSANPAIAAFTGRVWFEVNPAYRVRGQFVPQPQDVRIETMVNTSSTQQSPGVLNFELHGQPLQLLVMRRTGNKLSLLMRDATSGKETYGAVRFLTVEVDDEGNADVDFNKAYSPPCAFTPYATCPLPPRQNILPVRVVSWGALPAPLPAKRASLKNVTASFRPFADSGSE
ncbi:MAG: DUF1684 domain-containing protein [Anaerolineae bacterium]|nr:DUF1684 domain-containing protein [Anaerolineae bacterium]